MIAFPTSPFTEILVNTINSESYQDLCEWRNALSHRGTLGRRAALSTTKSLPSRIPANPKALPIDFDYSEELIPNLTISRMHWVINTTNEIILKFHEFIANQKSER